MGPGIAYLGTVMSGSPTEAAARAHVVEMILDRVLPGWRQGRPVQDKEYSWLRGQAARAKTALERRSELAEKLGENTPDLDAANLHPWAWENGKGYWNHGHYHQAVMQAAIRVNAEPQAKLNRLDVPETALSTRRFHSMIRSVMCRAFGLWKMMAVRRLRTCIGAPAPLQRACTRLSAIPGCMFHTTVVRSKSRWSSSRLSVYWLAGLIRLPSWRGDNIGLRDRSPLERRMWGARTPVMEVPGAQSARPSRTIAVVLCKVNASDWAGSKNESRTR